MASVVTLAFAVYTVTAMGCLSCLTASCEAPARPARARVRRLATFAMDGEVRFASATDRAAFAEELATAVTALIGKYHDESADGGREHRVFVAVHPTLKPRNESDRKES